MENPFIIITSQRTGGTTLNRNLNQISSFNSARQDEPFNTNRIYGGITKSFIKNGNTRNNWRAICSCMAQRENLKHCFENVPLTLTSSLIEASLASGHIHIFLYRKCNTSRILSFEYARRTGIWGPKKSKSIGQVLGAFDLPLDVEWLIEREKKIINTFNYFWKKFDISPEKRPIAISFEDIYEADDNHCFTALSRVTNKIGIPMNDDERALLASKIRAHGNQKTRNFYNNFLGFEELKERACSLPPYLFNPR